MSHHRFLAGGGPHGDDHRNGQRRHADHRERDHGIADQQRPSAEFQRAGLGVGIVVVVVVEFVDLARKQVAVVVGQRVRQLLVGRIGIAESGRSQRGRVAGEPGGRRHRRGIAGEPDRRGHRSGIPDQWCGRDRGPAGQREGGVFGNLHPHRRVAKLVGDLGRIGRGVHQIHVVRGVRVLAELGHHRVQRAGGVAAQELAGQHGGRRVLVNFGRAQHRQRRRVVVDHQYPAGSARGTHQGRHRLRLRQHRDVVDTGVLQRLTQPVGTGMVGPAQPGPDQPVVLVRQEPIRTDHGLRQLCDRVVSQVDDGLVDHVTTARTRSDERQAGDGAGDRDPQNDVHPCSPSAGHPRTSISRHHYTSVPSAVTIIRATPFALQAQRNRVPRPGTHSRVVRTEIMFPSKQRSRRGRGFPRHPSEIAPSVTVLDTRGEP